MKLAVPCDLDRRPIRDDSIFHEKTGIIEDKTGDRLAFNGSINETEFGWTPELGEFQRFHLMERRSARRRRRSQFRKALGG